MRNATEPPAVSPLSALVARVVDKAPPLTARQLANLAVLLRRPVDRRGEHR